MKKLALMVALMAAMSFGYCDYGSLKHCTISGGHYEGVYYFYGRGYRTFTFSGWCPYSVQYDFWTGRVCGY